MMADANDKQPNVANKQSDGGLSLDDLLTSLQQGVTAINNLTQSMSVIFPSS